MKINKYYRDAAHSNLNGSIAALFPVILLVAGNIIFFKNQEIFILTIPFIAYSFFSFQISLFRMKQSHMIARNIAHAGVDICYSSLLKAQHLLVISMNTYSENLQFYFPNGHLAGYIKKSRKRYLWRSASFSLFDMNDKVLGSYKIKGMTTLAIEVYDQNNIYLGSLEIRKGSWRKSKREFLSASGKYLGAVEGSPGFMDERIFNQHQRQTVRLRRGWMPVEWSSFFPEPNTPVLTFIESGSEKDKLLQMSFLIHEYFIER